MYILLGQYSDTSVTFEYTTFAIELSALILITIILQAIFITMNTNHIFESPGSNDPILHINLLITLSSPRHLRFIMFPI